LLQGEEKVVAKERIRFSASIIVEERNMNNN
jgi:hypothetical protein